MEPKMQGASMSYLVIQLESAGPFGLSNDRSNFGIEIRAAGHVACKSLCLRFTGPETSNHFKGASS